MKKQTKTLRKSLCMLLVLCTMIAVCAIPAVADDPVNSWTLGKDTALHDTAPFNWVAFYTGGLGENRVPSSALGFHDMIPYSEEGYTSPYGKLAGTAAHTSDPLGDGFASISGAGYQYCSPNQFLAIGFTFTAPYTGLVEFNYTSFTWMGDSVADLYIGKLNNNINLTFDTATKTYSGYEKKISVGTAQDAQTYSIEVEEGDKIYFLADERTSPANNFVALWLNSVEYKRVVAPSAEATVVGHGLVAADTLDVRFFVQLGEAPLSTPVATITVDTPEAVNPTYQVEGKLFTGTNSTTGKTYTEQSYVYCFTVSLSAKQMMDEITISLKNSGGVEMLTKGNTYRIAEYCQYWIAKSEENGATDADKAVANVCASMMLYGRMAQLHFNYNTQNLPKINNEMIEAILPTN